MLQVRTCHDEDQAEALQLPLLLLRACWTLWQPQGCADWLTICNSWHVQQPHIQRQKLLHAPLQQSVKSAL